MKKRLHHNGKYICDYESTGDGLKDVAIIDRLISERGLKAEPSAHRGIFQQAYSFITTAAHLYDRLNTAPPDGSAVAPFVVNTAFALELYIKTLALQHGKKLHGHELVKLFKNLPSAAKQEVEKRLRQLSNTSEWRCEIDSMDDLRAVIEDLNTAFVDWRYSYEQPKKALKVDFKPTIFLSEVLNAACQKDVDPPG
jgi:hypothetical protein